jgi:hypothetical protein
LHACYILHQEQLHQQPLLMHLMVFAAAGHPGVLRELCFSGTDGQAPRSAAARSAVLLLAEAVHAANVLRVCQCWEKAATELHCDVAEVEKSALSLYVFKCNRPNIP